MNEAGRIGTRSAMAAADSPGGMITRQKGRKGMPEQEAPKTSPAPKTRLSIAIGPPCLSGASVAGPLSHSSASAASSSGSHRLNALRHGHTDSRTSTPGSIDSVASKGEVLAQAGVVFVLRLSDGLALMSAALADSDLVDQFTSKMSIGNGAAKKRECPSNTGLG
jgi:hypothetical protein